MIFASAALYRQTFVNIPPSEQSHSNYYRFGGGKRDADKEKPGNQWALLWRNSGIYLNPKRFIIDRCENKYVNYSLSPSIFKLMAFISDK